ncbi:MAG: hypothetical protein B6242_12735 [Anaerolineaceae bacterium 4572_78]|nr:MAG: hypothetical protein B6242_12735 [Anaerolineaceae bacterium 4572_78]
MKPTKLLPDTYQLYGKVDFAENKKLLIILNVLSIIIFIIAGLSMWYIGIYLRPDIFPTEIKSIIWSIPALLLVLIALPLMIITHELLHGVVFWMFTKERPVYGVKSWCAFAGAPDWYLNRNQHLIAALAPLVVISLVGILLLPITPNILIPALFVFVVTNASGAIGDMYVSALLLQLHNTVLVKDTGVEMSIFEQHNVS